MVDLLYAPEEEVSGLSKLAQQRPRRTQAERRAETRRKLLDATIDCLVEYGYAGMTTAKVVERAGVTRGAQAHYFQTKASLVVAAIRHLAMRRAEEAFERMATIRKTNDPLDAALELLWETHNGPVFIATTELWLAARTDPELSEQMNVVEPMATSAILSFTQRFPLGKPWLRELQNFLYTAMDTVRGLMLGGFGLTEEEQLARWRRAKADLRALAEAKIAANGVTPKELNAILENAAK
nr:TetR/AcrR family transcriptional regulator [Sciscionella sp. SE31]